MGESYVVVDDNGDLAGGPYIWDGEKAWTPPVAGTLKTFKEWAAEFPDKAHPPAATD